MQWGSTGTDQHRDGHNDCGLKAEATMLNSGGTIERKRAGGGDGHLVRRGEGWGEGH